ncbi:unnamed protein product, partial [Nesidiocoris tenuis]
SRLSRHGDAPRCRNPSRAVPSRAIRALQSTILPTSRPDQHGGSFDQPPGTAQQAVALRFRESTTRAHVRLCNFMFGYPASANRLFAASVFRRLPSASRSLSCCGNILWFEKCNTSEYAAGGHRPTRSDAAKLMDNTTTIRNIFGLRIHIISTELQFMIYSIILQRFMNQIRHNPIEKRFRNGGFASMIPLENGYSRDYRSRQWCPVACTR